MSSIWHLIFYRGLYKDIWAITFPNWIAGAVAGTLAYIYGKKEIIKLHAKIDRNHQEMKEHITNSTARSKKGK